MVQVGGETKGKGCNFITAKLSAQVCRCPMLTAEQDASLHLGRFLSTDRMLPMAAASQILRMTQWLMLRPPKRRMSRMHVLQL